MSNDETVYSRLLRHFSIRIFFVFSFRSQRMLATAQAKADDSGSRGQLPQLQLRRQHCRERHFAVDRLLKDIFYCGADFRSVAIEYPDLLPFFEWAGVHYFYL